jgi:hypothetical protein
MGSIIIYTVYQILLGCKVVDGGLGGSCICMVEMINSYKILENPKGRGHLSDLGLVRRIILK